MGVQSDLRRSFSSVVGMAQAAGASEVWNMWKGFLKQTWVPFKILIGVALGSIILGRKSV